MVSKERLISIVDSFHDKRIAVAGDLMLDVYLKGKASRISPEAPVPVVRVKERNFCLGGAANVMRNAVTLGSSVKACGIIGKDANGENILSLLDSYSIDHSSVYKDPERKTTEKQRVIAGTQQVVRVDFEDTEEISGVLRDKMISDLISEIEAKKLDAVIFEDYAKGLLDASSVEKVSKAAQKHGTVVALDPHPGHPLRVGGLTLITPNRSEAFGLAGKYCTDPVSPVEQDSALREVADKLTGEWGAEYLLITLGAQGMALFEKGEKLKVIPTRAREVYDVSGAGDTVIAAFTLALISGASAYEAAEIANHAAGIVVGKVGTVSVSAEELIQSFENGD